MKQEPITRKFVEIRVTVAVDTVLTSEDLAEVLRVTCHKTHGAVQGFTISKIDQKEFKGQRFVWCVGAFHEQFPDIPSSVRDCDDTILWDRQEHREVMRVDKSYGQLMALEKTHGEGHAPFTVLEKWLASISDRGMRSERLAPTLPTYDLNYGPASVSR